MTVVRAHVSEPNTQYLGILNGVTYRIDLESGDSARIFGRASINVQAPEIVEGLTQTETGHSVAAAQVACPVTAPSAAASHAPVSGKEAIVDTVRADGGVRATTLFKREGGEPLRAGHPDLWRLLVAGTCLEGTTFQSA
jgi:hypothetical protein